MCLILFALDAHPRFRLMLAANRDEFYERPTTPAHFWEDGSGILAGRDLRSGGTWLGITRTGRIAAVTNYREPDSPRSTAPSRGALVAGFLRAREHAAEYLERLHRTSERYNGFNLLVGEGAELFHYSNREGVIRRVAPGVHGLSNHLLDTPWPKVMRGRSGLSDLLDVEDGLEERMLELLAHAEPAGDAVLPDTGVGPDWERVLSPAFIRTPSYGTRSSTVVLVDYQGGVTFVERTHGLMDVVGQAHRFEFDIAHTPVSGG